MQQGTLKTIIQASKKEAPFLLLCVLMLLLFSGAAYTVYLDDSIRYWDEKHYLLLKENLHNGIYSYNGTNPTAFQPPGYPLLLFLASLLYDGYFLLRFVNFLFLAAAVATLYWLLKQEEGPLAAILGAAMASSYPLFIYTAGTFYPQIVTSALFLFILALMLSRDKPDWTKELAIGVTLGAMLLVTPSFFLYMPLWLGYPWFSKVGKKVRAALLLLAGCLAVVFCWTARNAVTFDRFVLVSTNSGVNLLLGNSENTTPESGVNIDLSKYKAVARTMNEFDRNTYYMEEAVKWITDNPKEAFKLYILKTLNFFNFKNDLASDAEESWQKDLLSFISYYPVLLLALGRLLWARSHPLKSFEWFLVLFLVSSPFLHAIFFTRIRFRIPIDFITIYFAAGCLQFLLLKYAGDDSSPPLEEKR